VPLAAAASVDGVFDCSCFAMLCYALQHPASGIQSLNALVAQALLLGSPHLQQDSAAETCPQVGPAVSNKQNPIFRQ